MKVRGFFSRSIADRNNYENLGEELEPEHEVTKPPLEVQVRSDSSEAQSNVDRCALNLTRSKGTVVFKVMTQPKNVGYL